MADVNNDAAPKDEQESKPVAEETSTKESADESLDTSKEVEPEDSDGKEKKSDDPVKDDNADEEESEEEEELPPGLLERPLELEGKREKKKVDRLSASIAQPKEKKKVEIEEGKGVKLGDIDFIESRLNATKAADLKPLHRLLFLRIGAANDVKKNIRQFCGFTHSSDSKEHEKRVAILDKMFMPQLKSICLVLALERGGAKKDVVERIMEFLMNPVDKGKKVPQKKSRSKSSDGKKEDKKGKKRKRASKKGKSKKKDDDDEEDDIDDAGSLDEEEIEDIDDEADKDISEEEVEEVESEEEAPKKKKAKLEPKKKEANVNGKKEKSTPKPKKKEQKKESPKKKKVEEINDSLTEDSDSDDEPIAKKIKSPPSNDEIKKLVKSILEGADLEAVTMKTVVKEVYSKYPTFDLSDRKDFIKSTVREIIS